MMKIYFKKKSPDDYIGKKIIFNFFNLHDIWWAFNNKTCKETVSRKNNFNFPDGKNVARYLRIRQQRGPSFTKRFLTSKKAKNKKHFFIGNANIDDLVEKTNIKKSNMISYNPPYIQGLIFPKSEIEKIVNMLERGKFDFVWVCIGAPKQNILANELFLKYKADYFNVGAALDFLLEKKSEAPKIWTFLGLESLYRLVTDFKYSRKKVWRHLMALRYLKNIEVQS